jgi:hypothetical protein
MDTYTFAVKFTTQYVDVRINNDFEFYATLQQLAIFALAVALLRGRKLIKNAIAERRIGKRTSNATTEVSEVSSLPDLPDFLDDWK